MIRPLEATPAEIALNEKRNVWVPAEVEMVRQPRWSEPTEAARLEAVFERFVCTPDGPLLLMSSRPTRLAMCPAPSASKVAPIPAGPEESKPRSKIAYCPFRRDSLPEPQATFAALTVIEKVICFVIGTVSES